RQLRLATAACGCEPILPACVRGQAHQYRLDAATGLQTEERAAVVDEVELDVAATPDQLERALRLAPRRVAPAHHDRHIRIDERAADPFDKRARRLEGRAVLAVAETCRAEVVEEDAAHAAL